MAGIILGLGSVKEEKFLAMRKSFEETKGLKVSYEFVSPDFKFIKYRRRYDEQDMNCFESDEYVVLAVGSLLYKGYGFTDSVKMIGQDLDRGIEISEVIDDIDGTFCLIALNRREKKFYILTDIGGVINTYLREEGNGIYISTSMLSLATPFHVTPDINAILMFLRSGMFFDESTYFQEIKVLKPASIYEYDISMKTLKQKEYWSVVKEPITITFQDATEALTKALVRIIDAIPNGETMYDLTGGYDSRFVVALAYSREKNSGCLNTFFFGPPNSREARIVEETCRNTGIRYHNYVIESDWGKKFFDYIVESHRLCDGMESAPSYAQILKNQELKIKNNFKYTVHGDFGELFRQRMWEFEFGRRGKRKPADFKRLIRYRNFTEDFDLSIFSDAYMDEVRNLPERLLNIYHKTARVFNERTPNTLQLDYIYFAQRARRWGGRGITTTNQIIQPICPLWFRRPLEISFSLPPEYKKRCKLLRFIVEKEAPLFANQKMITGAPYVVMNLRNLPLFIPGAFFFLKKVIRKVSQVAFNRTIWAGLTVPDYNTGEWFREALKDERCRDLLEYDKMVSRSFYDEGRFKAFIGKAGEVGFHFYGQLGNMITAELTLRAAKMVNPIDIR